MSTSLLTKQRPIIKQFQKIEISALLLHRLDHLAYYNICMRNRKFLIFYHPKRAEISPITYRKMNGASQVKLNSSNVDDQKNIENRIWRKTY